MQIGLAQDRKVLESKRGCCRCPLAGGGAGINSTLDTGDWSRECVNEEKKVEEIWISVFSCELARETEVESIFMKRKRSRRSRTPCLVVVVDVMPQEMP